MMNEPIKSSIPVVHCDGKENSNLKNPGHPTVYLSLKGKNSVECSYCGQKFLWVDEENR
jgi:uncharacterized Zn-finger protein